MMGANIPRCANGAMVSHMSTQRQAQAARTPAEPLPEPPAWRVAADQANGAGLHFGSAEREPWDYVPMPPFGLDEDGYLIDDSMGQHSRHAGRMLAYGPALKERYRGRGGYVGVDLFMPYVKGSPGKTVAPDLFAALAAKEDEDRFSYKLWEEPAPDFVLEDLSPANWRRDAVDKRVLYQRFGVREYFMFDETAKRLRDDSGARLGVPLVGYRLRDGEYQRMSANDAGRLPSEALGLELCVRDGLVRFYDPATGEYLRTFHESEAQIRESEARAVEERVRRQAAERRAASAEQRAEVEAQRLGDEQAKTAAALERVAALEAELRAQHDSS